MKQKTYLKKLREHLEHLEKEEVDEFIADYTEHFEAGKQNGRSEEEIAKALGTPAMLAKHIKAQSKIKKAEETKNPGDITRAVLATVGLGLLNIIFVLGPVLGLLGALLGVYAAGIGLFAGGVASILLSTVGVALIDNVVMTVPVVGAVFVGIGLMAAGVAVVLIAWVITRYVIKALLWYLRANVRLVRGEQHA